MMTPPTAQEPLGTLLVKRGLLTDEQLSEALAEQKASGEPLGKIVVARGFASPATIAQALATQHGGVLKTEYGFATGFGTALQPPTTVAAPPVSAGRAAAPAAGAARTGGAPRPADSLREELAHAAAETEKLRADNERLAQLRSDLERRVAAESQRAAALERELTAAKEAGPASGGADRELEKQLAHEVRRASTLEAEVAARDAAIEDFRKTGEGWKKALAERDEAITSLVAARDEALAKLKEGSAPDVAGLEAELEKLRAEREEVQAHLQQAPDVAKLEAELDELRAARDEALAQFRATKGELAARDARIPELTRERDGALARVKELEQALAVGDEVVAARDAAIEALKTKEAELAQPKPEPARFAGADRHLLFFCGAEGWELVERSGPPPAPGDRVEVTGGSKIVARIAASPAPGSDLPCAFLLCA
jgi:DNA repair exonuclease SbcCD ATPase subunit